MKKTLVCWIGHTDLRCARGEEGEALGPIGQAVKEHAYASVELIANEPKKDVATFRTGIADYVKWLENLTDAPIRIHQVTLSSPMEFGEVFEAADDVVGKVLAGGAESLVFHLSPGTSAMMAMWLVLATTKYPAELIASSKETGVYTPEFPFEIAADYLPRKRAAVTGKIVQAAFDDRTPPDFEKIIHRCDAMKKVIARAQRVAQFDVPVMILGETGTGKELFAEAIHNASPRSTAPYIAVNCGAIPKEIVNSELFGHKKGAFTGADSDRIGMIEQADHGTLFLDELGELPLDVQVKLLRAVQLGEVCPMGSKDVKKDTKRVDIRIISATHCDLKEMIDAGRFREDLYHRLAVGILTLPPLRKRSGDLALLIDFRMNELKHKLIVGKEAELPKLTAGARSVLNHHPWTGNIRELFNALTRAVIWAEGDSIEKHDIESAMEGLSVRSDRCAVLERELLDGFSMPALLEEVETHFINKALNEASDQEEAARLLGLKSGAALRYRLKALKLSRKQKK